MTLTCPACVAGTVTGTNGQRWRCHACKGTGALPYPYPPPPKDHMTVTDTPTTELVPISLSVTEARTEMERYQEMCKALLTPDDVQKIGSGTFTKRSGFQKLAAAYGVSTEIRSLDVERDPAGQLLRARAIVHATHPNGRHTDGDGACSIDESRFNGNRQKIEHDLPATAVTRATNRAVSNLIAFGTVSAEEADTSPPGGLPAWAQPAEMEDLAGVSHSLVRILQALGAGDEVVLATSQIGRNIRAECDGQIPVCVVHLIDRIHNYVTETPNVS